MERLNCLQMRELEDQPADLQASALPLYPITALYCMCCDQPSRLVPVSSVPLCEICPHLNHNYTFHTSSLFWFCTVTVPRIALLDSQCDQLEVWTTKVNRRLVEEFLKLRWQLHFLLLILLLLSVFVLYWGKMWAINLPIHHSLFGKYYCVIVFCLYLSYHILHDICFTEGILYFSVLLFYEKVYWIPWMPCFAFLSMTLHLQSELQKGFN